MRIWLALLIVFSLTFVVGCEPPPEEDQPAKPKEKGPEDASKRVEVKYQFPAEKAHKSARYEFIFRDGAYEYDSYALEKPETMDALLAAVTNLVPSDTLLTCKPNPAKPTLAVTLPVEGELITLTSSSNCANWAPWNVVKGGKLYAQVDGKIGEALLPLLQSIGSKHFAEINNPAGVIALGGGAKPAEGVEAQQSVSMSYLDAITKSAADKGLGTRKITDLKLVCDQAQSKNCSKVRGMATIELAEGFLYEIQLTAGANGVEELVLPDFAALDALLASKPAQALEDAATDSVRVAYTKEGQCEAVQAAAPIYKPDAAPADLSCEQYVLVAAFTEPPESVPPKLVYFPGIEACWLSLTGENIDMTFLDAFESSEEVTEALEGEAGAFFVNLEGVMAVVK